MGSGFSAVWTSPVIELLKSNNTQENPLGHPVSIYEISWITSLFTLGIAIGPLFLTKLSDIIGRKWSLIGFSTLLMVSFIGLAVGDHIYYYYVSRFVQGLSVGFMIAVIPLYLAEITEDGNRGKFGTFTSLFASIGNLLGFVLGSFFDLKTYSLLMTIPLVINILCFTFLIPESPIFLAVKKKRNDAIKSLMKFLKMNYVEAGKHLLVVEDMLERTSQRENTHYLSKLYHTRKSIFIGMGVSAVQAASGIFAILGYLQPILKAADNPVSENISSIIVGIIQIILAISTSFLIDRWGRRTLMLGSSAAMVLSFCSLGGYFFLRQVNYSHLSWFSWLPVMSIIIYIMAQNIGVGPVSFVIRGEIFATDVKAVASSISLAILGFLSFIVTFTFPICYEFLGPAWCFFIMAGINALGFVYLVVCLPETKGKSFLEIHEMLNGKSTV